MEKRRCQRINLELPAVIQAIGSSAGLSKAMAVDISALGIRLLTDEPLAAGQEISLQLDADGQKLDLAVKVVWAKEADADNPGKHFSGVKILETPGRDEIKFVSFFAKKLIALSKR